MFSGLLILDKPAGVTSRRAVNTVKHLLPRGTKIGHAGTLDSFATGVLLLLIGRATKSCEMLMGQPKTYVATMKLGATTATDDPLSPEEPFAADNVAMPIRAAVEAALPQFVGEILQRPPQYSALKIGGRRASDRVREGEKIELQPRKIQIDSIELIRFEPPFVDLKIDCGRGTYIRSIARDLGAALGVGAYLTELRRTRIGPYSVDIAVPLSSLSAENLAALIQSTPES